MRISELIQRQAAGRPESPALLAPGRNTLSYHSLGELIACTVKRLNALGIGRNDRVAIVLPNGPEMAAGFVSIASGAVCAPLNPAYGESEFHFYLTDLCAKILVMPEGMDSPALAVAASLGIPVIRMKPGDAAGTFSLEGATGLAPVSDGFSGPDNEALVLHTSGTTSRPKIVPLTHRNLCASADNIRRSLALRESDRCLNVMPLFHIHGLVGATLSSFAAGASVVCTPGFYAPVFFDWVSEFEPTWYTAVPTMHQAILARAETNRDIVARHKLRFVRSCSAALPPSVMADLEATFRVPVIESYGMTEAAHQMASNPLPPAARKPGSVGVAAGPEIAIMDDTGALLAPGQTGEIVIRGENVTSGYENNPAANKSAFTNGWFRTGDQGYRDEEGYFFLTGRLKELINRGGEKISPREIDEVLLTYPGVVQAVAFSVPHIQLGEEVGAAVILKEGATPNEHDIRKFCGARLAAFKVPRIVRIVTEIPKGPTGKIQRIGLAEKLGIEPLDDARAAATGFEAPGSELERQIADIWSGVLRIEKAGIHDNFFASGGDSILASVLITKISEELDVAIPLLSFLENPTISALSNVIAEARSNDPGGSAWSGRLLPVQPHGDKPPLFCATAHTGNVLIYSDLARDLPPDQPVFGFLPRTDHEHPTFRIEELAAKYIDDMRTRQPHGPYFLCGYCFGGLVVYEMAAQLVRQGEQVAMLVLLNGFNPAWAESLSRIQVILKTVKQVGRRVRHHFDRLRMLQPKEIGLYLYNHGRVYLGVQARQIGFRTITRLGLRVPAKLQNEGEPNTDALRRYRPPTYPGSAILIRMQQNRKGVSPDPHMGWEGLILGGIEFHEILPDPFPPSDSVRAYPPVPVAKAGPIIRTCLEKACAPALAEGRP